MKINKVHHIAIITSDYQKAIHFYQDILGLTLEKETYRAARQSYKADLYLNGEYTVELFSFHNPPKRLSYPEATGLRHLAFEVDNIENTFEEFESKGIHPQEIRIDELTGKKFFFIYDPDELPIEFYEK